MDKMHHRVGVILCRQTSLGSWGLVLDAFRMANLLGTRHVFELTRVSQDGLAVGHPDGTLSVDRGLDALTEMDAVLIPSLWLNGPQAVAEQGDLIQALRHLAPSVLVATLCTGAYLLAASGRLDGRVATTHWMLADGFQTRFPRVQLHAEQNLTHQDGVVCSGGSLAAVDVCLFVIQLLAGRSVARQTARLLVTDLHRGPQTLYTPPQGWRRHQDEDIHRLEAFIAQHHAQALSLQQLADQIHTSVRTLQRRFQTATGMSPIQYQQAIRVDKAKERLEESSDPVGLVAEKVGYLDRVAFGRLFKKVTGLTPAAYRQQHAWGHSSPDRPPSTGRHVAPER
ncbi:MAG: helix-turn-helix domain-containing protein [Burkholderiales bacterium]|nr:helix-turn-helix domain-containing protein [Burkholderiales bacterium]